MSALDTLLYGYRTLLAATVAVSQRSKLNFSSAFSLTDNAVTESTDVALSGTQSITTANIVTMILSVLRLTSENNALSGSQNDVTIGSNTIVRVTDAGAVTWTGIVADSGRRILLVHAVGAGGLTLVHASGSSVASNRFALPGGANVALTTNQIAILVYDTTQARWLLVGSMGGGSFTPPSGTGLVTVTGGALDGASSPVGTGVLTFLGTPSSANLAAAVTGETGSGALVFGTEPTLSLPVFSGARLTKTTSAATGNQAAFSVTGVSWVVFTGGVTVNLQGLAGGVDGQILVIKNRGTANVNLVHESGSASAADRYWDNTATDYAFAAGAGVVLIYDAADPGGGGAAGRWTRYTYM